MHYKERLKRVINKLPFVQLLNEKVKFYESNFTVPPGHFYSPIVDVNEILRNENKIFNFTKTLHGIELNESEQYSLLDILKEYYLMLSFSEDLVPGKRYFYNNTYYSYSDVIFLFSMISHFKPNKIIEIGSGFSSAAMLDVNEEFFENSIDITFIEPFPETLKKVVKPGDKFTLIEKNVQEVDIEIFKLLQENDILFIDSTHVAKTNSDVLFEIFEILPLLNKGVKIHIHDIFYPFEYPRKWIINDRKNWNEIYFLRSFLMYNNSFKILAFNTYMEQVHTQWFKENMPLCLKNTGGSCWLEKVA